MVGIGRIFEAYRDGILEDDDEVAVLHGPEELGYPAVTDAMVNIRATLDKAVGAGVLDRSLAGRLTKIGKSLFYKERSWDAILRAAARDLSPMPLDHLAAWLSTGQIDQKRIDTLEMIAAIRRHGIAGVFPLKVRYRFHATGYHRAAAGPAPLRRQEDF
jgi:hypothetical protein